MKRVTVSPETALAVVALVALASGVYLVAGLGWALIVAASLVLVYIVLPDQGVRE